MRGARGRGLLRVGRVHPRTSALMPPACLLPLAVAVVVLQELFPFIASERFTLEQFVREPRRWFWFTGEWDDWF